MTKRRKSTHKWVQERVETDNDNGTPIQDVIAQLQDKASHLEDAVVHVLSDDDDWYGIILVRGWRPMTDAEKRKYKADSERAKAAAEKKKQRERERDERTYEILRRRLGKAD